MAKTRCPAQYKNLGLETFGNKKKVTEEILKQCCKNDEWLRQQVIELRYLTPPAIRKRMSMHEWIDKEKSWGCTGVDDQEPARDNKIQFSSLIRKKIVMDFTNEDGLKRWVDDVKSTTEVVSDQKQNGDKFSKITLPQDIKTVVHEKTFGTADKYDWYNSAWYVGFDKTKPFYLKPSWIKDWKAVNASVEAKKRIPAIARSQTFTVPDDCEGTLTQVDLQLEYNGTPTMSSSPLYVQIWNTYKGWVNKTEWDNEKKEVVTKYQTLKQHHDIHGEYPPASWTRWKKVTVYKKNKKGDYIYTGKGNKKKRVVDYKKYVKWDKSKYGAYDNDKTYVVKRVQVPKPYSKKGTAIKKPLAEYVHNPTETTKGGQQTMTFENPCEIKAGESYAIVLLSPFNNWENCPRWCGWGRNCKKNKKSGYIYTDTDDTSDGAVYSGGDAFYSTDNGISWKRYGKNGDEDDITVYKQGKYAPQDYRFRCRVKTAKDETITNYPTDRHELYLKPIFGNPIYGLDISTLDYGTNESERDTVTIDYEISTDGDTWHSIEVTEYFNFIEHGLEPSRVVFLRALLQTTNGGDANNDGDAPYIEKIEVTADMYLPNEMYVRSKAYKPEKLGTILGASVWGRVFAPYELEDENDVDCKVDIIETKEDLDSYDIVEVELLEEKLKEKLPLESDWIDDCEDADAICDYLSKNPIILEKLKEVNVYVLPHEMNDRMYNLSFAPSEDRLYDEALPNECSDKVITIDNEGEPIEETGENIPNYPDILNGVRLGGIKISKEVAYPVVSCELEPEDGSGHGKVDSYGEWYDYLFDYQKNELIFKRDTLSRMPSGTLKVKYNPVFVKDLTNNEIGIHYDEEGNRSDGLVLDYFKETIEVTYDILQTNTIKLRVEALDPIRQIFLYSAREDEPISLKEDLDYYYDINTHEIILDEDEMRTVLLQGDVLEIVYTPNLDDESICVGFNATRKDTTKQCTIEDFYIEYKT